MVETGTSTPIPGVAVTLNEFGPNDDNFIVSKVVVSTVTDGNGGFILRPGHFGEFRLVATKEGYNGSSGAQYTLTAAAPRRTAQVTMARPGTLTGTSRGSRRESAWRNLRLMVEGVPKPASNGVLVGCQSVVSQCFRDYKCGRALQRAGPGARSYRVHVGRNGGLGMTRTLRNTPKPQFKIVDEDVEPSYWPGGVAEAAMVLPTEPCRGARLPPWARSRFARFLSIECA